MGRTSVLLLALVIVLMSAAGAMASKENARVEALRSLDAASVHAAPQFATAVQCTVNNLGDPAWQISGWLIGMELYKSYQDPGQSCSGPYPFSVEEVHMMIWANTLPCTLFVSVDVESADLTDPDCPVPGELLSLSSEYMFILDQAGYNLYLISVPLDSTATVDGPYFAGFYIANVIDESRGVQMITDDFPALCRDYNIWDPDIGYIDLASNDYFEFPGRIYMFTTGQAGGSGGIQPEPVLSLLKPSNNEIITGPLEVWGVESAGSEIIDSVVFSYKNGGAWTRFDNDNDGSRALRNGVDPAGTGEGFYTILDYFTLNEALYWVKATAYDSLGRTSTDSHLVSIDPTPPDPTLVNPVGMDTLCLPAALIAESDDENLDVMRFMRKNAASNYAVGAVTLNQFDYGDGNGNPVDGNPASAGEDGDYYSGPVAAATAIKYWFDKGFLNTMKEGQYYIPVDTVVERMATLMRTKQEDGTYDDMFYYGLTQYNQTHGNLLLFNSYPNPDYLTMRSLFQEEENFVVMGIGGDPGIYLCLVGVNGLEDLSGYYDVTVTDPVNGTNLTTDVRMNSGNLEILFQGTWHPVDILITVIGGTHTVTWDLIANDADGINGWSYNWSSSTLSDGDLAFISAMAIDDDGRTASDHSLIVYDCGAAFTAADYDGDSDVDSQDLLYLINFIYKDGPIPAGGAHRADANCDDVIDISDVIYAINFFYSGGPSPCY